MTTEREAIKKLWKAAATAGAISVILRDGIPRWNKGTSLRRIFENRESALREFYFDVQAAMEVHGHCPGLLQSMLRDLRDTSMQMLAATLPDRLEDLSRPTFLSFHGQLASDAERLMKACDAVLEAGDEDEVARAPATESEVGKIVAQVNEFGGELLAKIMAIMNGNLSADQKMRQAAELDVCVYQYDSPKWAELTGTTDANIRKTDFWKTDRPRFIAQAREHFAAENPGERLPPWLQ